MAGADVSLKSLEFQLDKQLQHLPFDRLETKHLADEPDALSFKILLGYIKAESDNDKLETWVHFYPAKTYNGNSETQFHNYFFNGQYFGKSDGETISRDLCGCAPAFAMPKLSRGKLIALAKYYFLRKVVESDSGSDREMLKHGVKISRTFREDLKSVCKEFEEDRPSPFASPATKPNQESSQETGKGFSEGTTAMAQGALEVGHATAKTLDEEAVQELLRIDQDEDIIIKNLIKVERRKKDLRAKQRAIEDEQAELSTQTAAWEKRKGELEKRRYDVLRKQTAERAYNLGRRVECEGTQKRARLVEDADGVGAMEGYSYTHDVAPI